MPCLINRFYQSSPATTDIVVFAFEVKGSSLLFRPIYCYGLMSVRHFHIRSLASLFKQASGILTVLLVGPSDAALGCYRLSYPCSVRVPLPPSCGLLETLKVIDALLLWNGLYGFGPSNTFYFCSSRTDPADHNLRNVHIDRRMIGVQAIHVLHHISSFDIAAFGNVGIPR